MALMSQIKKRRAVFFDRDGVILKVVDSGTPRPPYSVAEYREKGGVVPGAKETIEVLRQRGFLVILATNQPDIKYEKITKEDWQWIHDQISDIPFDDVYICFHGREDDCSCKKPKPGMLFEAAKKWNIDLAQSFVVGDTDDDTGSASAAGAKSILIDAPYNRALKSDIRIHSLGELDRRLSSIISGRIS